MVVENGTCHVNKVVWGEGVIQAVKSGERGEERRGSAPGASRRSQEGWREQEAVAGEKGRDHRASQQYKDLGFCPIELRPRRCAAYTEGRRPWPPEPALSRPAVARLAHAHSPRAARRPPLAPWCCLAQCRPSRRPARTRPSAPGSCAALRRAARPLGSPGPTGAPAPPCRSAARPLPLPGELRFPAALTPLPVSETQGSGRRRLTTSDLREGYGFRRAGAPLPASKGRLRELPLPSCRALEDVGSACGEGCARGRPGWRPAAV